MEERSGEALRVSRNQSEIGVVRLIDTGQKWEISQSIRMSLRGECGFVEK